MNYRYLMYTCIFVVGCYGAAMERKQIFSEEQRDEALDFVGDIVEFLQENAAAHLDFAEHHDLPLSKERWECALRAVTHTKYRVDIWRDEDEALALATHKHMLTTDVWAHYLISPTSLEHFERLYTYMSNYNRVKLEQHIGKTLVPYIRDNYESIVCPIGVRFDAIMLLSMFLLNETYVGNKAFEQARAASRKAAAERVSIGGAPTLMRSASLRSLNLLATQ